MSAFAKGLFLMAPWVGLHGVIVVFPDHTHLLFILNDQCGLSSGSSFKASLILLFSCIYTHSLVEKAKLIISGS